jgi:hypothetical protein
MPRSPVPNGGAGNVNLKGKKYKLMRCGCCAAYDFRDEYKKNLDKKMIREYNAVVAQG